MNKLFVALSLVTTFAHAQSTPISVKWEYFYAPCTAEGCVIERPEEQDYQINVYLKENSDTFSRVSVLFTYDAKTDSIAPQLIISRYGDTPDIEDCPRAGDFCTYSVTATITSSGSLRLPLLKQRPSSMAVLDYLGDDFAFKIRLSAADTTQKDVLDMTLTVTPMEKRDGEWIEVPEILGTKTRPMTFGR